jgi:hypothetical protein
MEGRAMTHTGLVEVRQQLKLEDMILDDGGYDYVIVRERNPSNGGRPTYAGLARRQDIAYAWLMAEEGAR